MPFSKRGPGRYYCFIHYSILFNYLSFFYTENSVVKVASPSYSLFWCSYSHKSPGYRLFFSNSNLPVELAWSLRAAWGQRLEILFVQELIRIVSLLLPPHVASGCSGCTMFHTFILDHISSLSISQQGCKTGSFKANDEFCLLFRTIQERNTWGL